LNDTVVLKKLEIKKILLIYRMRVETRTSSVVNRRVVSPEIERRLIAHAPDDRADEFADMRLVFLPGLLSVFWWDPLLRIHFEKFVMVVSP